MGEKVELDFSEEDLKKMKKSAKAHNMDLSEFIISIIRHAMEKTTH